MMKAFKALLILAAGLVGSSFAQENEAPTVILPGSEIRGVSANGVESFFGMPYAESPAGRNRLKRPVRRAKPLGLFDATTIAPRCHHGYFPVTPFDYPWEKKFENPWQKKPGNLKRTDDMPSRWEVASEDCLTITVQRPAGTKAGDGLPVLFMIQGYGFVVSPSPGYNTTDFINFSIDNEQPFIFVTANYRVGAWGFLPGQQVMDNKTTNLGLYDQRMSMEWTSDNIEAFGGDPGRVTLWGHAAGGVSVLSHLVSNGGDATYNDRQLFHGAIMSSGSLMPAEFANSTRSQEVYDEVVLTAGCQNADDSLQCLRELSTMEFGMASDSIPGANSVEALRLLYIPRPDGELIQHSPEKLLSDGMFPGVPMILGNQEDEATIFTQVHGLFEYKGSYKFNSYLRDHYFYNFTELGIQDFTAVYSKRPRDGSPYRTKGHFEEWLGKKRIASMLGDLFFVFPRRLALNLVASSRPAVPLWGYQASHDYLVRSIRAGALGTTHGSFEDSVFATGSYRSSSHSTTSVRTYFNNFVYHLDPNKGIKGAERWPEWTIDEPRLLWINRTGNAYILDKDRSQAYNYMKRDLDQFRL